MKSAAIFGCILPLFLAVPAMGQEPETPKRDGNIPHVKIERKIIKIDSLGNRTEIDDNSTEEFDSDVSIDIAPDGGFNLDVEINGDPSSPEFQAKMKEFEERMNAFGERMKEFGEKMKEGDGEVSIELRREIEEMRHSEEQMREMDGEMRVRDDQMRQIEEKVREVRLGGGLFIGEARSSMGGCDTAIQSLQIGLKAADDRVKELRSRLATLPKDDPAYAPLTMEIDRASADLNQARAAIERAQASRQSVVFVRKNRGGGASAYNINGMQINIDSVVSSAVGDGASVSIGATASTLPSNGRGHRMMVRVSSDTAHGPCVLIHSLTATEGALPPSADLTQGPITLKRNVFYIGSDSVHLVDGKADQMVLRIDNGTSDNGKLKVMVMSLERGCGADLRPQSQGATLLADAPLVPRGSAGYQLGENVPNPFAEKTAISFTLPKSGHVMLSVFDGTGNIVRTLKNEAMPAGTHSVNFDASGLPSGIYLYRLVADGFSEAKTMTIAK